MIKLMRDFCGSIYNCKRYSREINADKIKVMINSANIVQRKVKVKEQKLATVRISSE